MEHSLSRADLGFQLASWFTKREVWSNLKGQIYLGDEVFVTEMQKRIEKEKDDLAIPSSKYGRWQSLCLKLQHNTKAAKRRSLLLTKQVHIASEKSESFAGPVPFCNPILVP